MNRTLQWKLIAGFVLVFLAGALTGGFVAGVLARHFFFGPPHPGMVAERMREHLRNELKLTPEQLTKISPIIDKTGAQLEQIQMETGRRVHETFAEAHREMSPNLTDEQRARLEKMRQRHRRWMHHIHGPEALAPEPHLP